MPHRNGKSRHSGLSEQRELEILERYDESEQPAGDVPDAMAAGNRQITEGIRATWRGFLSVRSLWPGLARHSRTTHGVVDHHMRRTSPVKRSGQRRFGVHID